MKAQVTICVPDFGTVQGAGALQDSTSVRVDDLDRARALIPTRPPPYPTPAGPLMVVEPIFCCGLGTRCKIDVNYQALLVRHLA